MVSGVMGRGFWSGNVFIGGLCLFQLLFHSIELGCSGFMSGIKSKFSNSI